MIREGICSEKCQNLAWKGFLIWNFPEFFKGQIIWIVEYTQVLLGKSELLKRFLCKQHVSVKIFIHCVWFSWGKQLKKKKVRIILDPKKSNHE